MLSHQIHHLGRLQYPRYDLAKSSSRPGEGVRKGVFPMPVRLAGEQRLDAVVNNRARGAKIQGQSVFMVRESVNMIESKNKPVHSN
jgi:hypothetical protein